MVYLSGYSSISRRQDIQKEHELGRALLHFGLEREYGRVFNVGFKYGNKYGGKPVLTDADGIYFNISHTTGMVACGISERDIGIDTELIRRYDKRLMHRVCTAEEIDYICADSERERERFFRLWTLKESFLKAMGKGLAVPMREVSFDVWEWDGNGGDLCGNMCGWKFRQFKFDGIYIVSICERCEGTLL